MAPPLRRKKRPPTHKHKVDEGGLGKCVVCGRKAEVPPWDFRSTDCGGLFIINDVLRDPQGCRSKCSAEFFDEKVCQVLLKDKYGPGKRCSPLDDDSYKVCLDESFLESIYSDGIQVARTHKMIADIILKPPLGRLFERMWKTMSLKQRRDAIFQSLDNALRPNSSFERRLLLPDFSGALAEGEAFLDLLRLITYSGVKYQGNDYIPVPSQEFEFFYRMDTKIDDLPSNRAGRAYHAHMRHARNRAISNFVLELLHKWFLRHPPQVIAGAVLQKPRKIICCAIPTSRFDACGKNTISHELNYDVETEAEEEESKESFRELCRCCRRTADEILEFDDGSEKAHGTVEAERNKEEEAREQEVSDEKDPKKEKEFHFFHCSYCLNLGRRVAYCSKTCQQADWKNHKIFCNKRFVDLNLPFAGEHPRSTVPLPSFTLLWQIDQRGKKSTAAAPDSSPDSRSVFYRVLVDDPSKQTSPLDPNALGLQAFLVQEQTRHLLPLMDRAVETRSKEDVAHFFREFAAILFLRDPSFEEAFIVQLSKDWEIERTQAEEWIREGLDIGFERGVARLRLGIV